MPPEPAVPSEPDKVIVVDVTPAIVQMPLAYVLLCPSIMILEPTGIVCAADVVTTIGDVADDEAIAALRSIDELLISIPPNESHEPEVTVESETSQ